MAVGLETTKHLEMEKKPFQSTHSIEYLTGQIIHTMLTAGVTESERKQLKKGAKWLLSRQQEFGGWMQIDSIENFTTPFRESRYAVMALSTLYPKGKKQNHGLGNRGGKTDYLPRKNNIVEILTQLDTVWFVPEHLRDQFAAQTISLLDHRNAFVRAMAAQCLGRLGVVEAVQPLTDLLEAPEKMVWQSAAWALRRFGNQGVCIKTILRSLQSLIKKFYL